MTDSDIPKHGFTADYYNHKYFADPKGKAFYRPNGTIEYWGYKNPEAEFLGARDIAKAWKTIFNPRTVLDAFCGRGTFISYMRDFGIEAYGFDFSEFAINNPYPRCKKEWLKLHDGTKRWPYNDKSSDLVTMLDAYEHLYLDDLEFVISEMFRVSKKWIFLEIATVDGTKEKGYALKKGEPIPWEDGRTWAGHCTVMPSDFWYERFEHDEWMIRRDLVNWFCSLVDKSIIRNWLLNSIIIMSRI